MGIEEIFAFWIYSKLSNLGPRHFFYFANNFPFTLISHCYKCADDMTLLSSRDEAKLFGMIFGFAYANYCCRIPTYAFGFRVYYTTCYARWNSWHFTRVLFQQNTNLGFIVNMAFKSSAQVIETISKTPWMPAMLNQPFSKVSRRLSTALHCHYSLTHLILFSGTV